jgi:hypothetical protein
MVHLSGGSGFCHKAAPVYQQLRFAYCRHGPIFLLTDTDPLRPCSHAGSVEHFVWLRVPVLWFRVDIRCSQNYCL